MTHGPRKEWEPFDLRTNEGLKIEIKSAAFIQSWFQKRHSSITFGIQPARKWDATTNQISQEKKRQSDIYIFCLLNHKDQETIDPLNLDQWDFYILPTSTLNRVCPTQKTITLSSLIKLNPNKVKYEEIALCLQEISANA